MRTRQRCSSIFLFLSFALLFGPRSADAAPIALDTWYIFIWDGAAPASTSGFPGNYLTEGGTQTFGPGDSPWTINLAAPGTITVVDAFILGDSFEVFDFAVSLGSTSAPGVGDCPIVDDPVSCLSFPAASSGVFALGAGAHSLTIFTEPGSLGTGAAYFIVESVAVPEPATLLLTGLGLAGMAYRRRRRA